MVNLELYLKQLPSGSGVYLYYDKTDTVIYVGKAKSLKKRVKTYFQKNQLDLKTKKLVENISRISVIETEQELDALFLESELIKRYQPKYNILLRDDKNSSYIKISNDLEPIVSFTRTPIDDGAEYFGPFYSVYPIKQALRQLRWIFPYLVTISKKQKSFLNKHIGLEPKLQTAADYQKYYQDLHQLKLYIKGQRQQIIHDLEKQMRQLSNQQKFEQASVIRNQIKNLNNLQHKVRLLEDNTISSSDQGLIDLGELFNLSTSPYRIEGYDISHSSGTNVVASMVVFSNGLAHKTEYRKFKIKIDQNDDFFNLNEALKRRWQQTWPKPDLILIDGGKGQLMAAIDATDKNLKIPIFGLAKKQELIIIHKQLSNIKLDYLKLDQLRARVFAEGDFFVISVPKNQPAIQLLQRIRNEAHRFAIGYHHRLMIKQQTFGALDELRGIGAQTKQKLIKHYKTLSKLKQSDLDGLTQLVGRSKAKLLFDYFDSQK